MNQMHRLIGAALCAAVAGSAHAGLVVVFDDGSGLSAEAEFTLLGAGDEIEIRLKNTSTAIPNGFGSSDQILTGISWDFGDIGFPGIPTILSGSVIVGPTSSADFDAGIFGPGSDISGEWGYGNEDGTGALANFVSANTAQGTPFGGPNLDGPASVDGPQGGLISALASVPLGGNGAVTDEIIITIQISHALSSELEIFGELGKARIEFGSDAHFIEVFVPSPGTAALLAAAGLLTRRRRP